jgi:hypothetical protein
VKETETQVQDPSNKQQHVRPLHFSMRANVICTFEPRRETKTVVIVTVIRGSRTMGLTYHHKVYVGTIKINIA